MVTVVHGVHREGGNEHSEDTVISVLARSITTAICIFSRQRFGQRVLRQLCLALLSQARGPPRVPAVPPPALGRKARNFKGVYAHELRHTMAAQIRAVGIDILVTYLPVAPAFAGLFVHRVAPSVRSEYPNRETMVDAFPVPMARSACRGVRLPLEITRPCTGFRFACAGPGRALARLFFPASLDCDAASLASARFWYTLA